MSDNEDYQDILSGTVNEAKNQILELEEPDYEQLLELEVEGDNRKTLRQWLEKNLEEEKKEEGAEEAVDEMFLSSISPSSALVGGLVLGLVAGLVAASFVSLPGTGDAAPAEVESSVQEWADAVSGVDQFGVESAEVSSVTESNGMFLVGVEMQIQGLNGTETQNLEMYVSPDGQMLFQRGQTIDQAIQQVKAIEGQQIQPQEEPAGNQTTQ